MTCLQDVPIVVRTKFPAKVHVLGIVSNEDDVIPQNFFKKRKIVTKEVYLRVLMDVVKLDGNCSFRKAIFFSAERCNDSYESLDSKLTLRQHRCVLVQDILASQQARFKSLGLCMQHN